MFELKIETGNAAFGDSDEEKRAEVARLLETVVYRLLEENDTNGQLRDVNGNTVGSYTFTV